MSVTSQSTRRAALEELKGLVHALVSAVRARQLYPAKHTVVRRAVEDLTSAAEAVGSSGPLELRVEGDFLRLEGGDLLLDASTHRDVDTLRSLMRAHGVQRIRAQSRATPEEWLAFSSLVGQAADELEPLARLQEAMRGAGIASFTVAGEGDEEAGSEGAPGEGEGEGEGEGTGLAAARRTYERSVTLAREIFTQARLGRAVNGNRVRAGVQQIVDRVLLDQHSIMAMTVLRDYDEYTFTHSVNVAIISGLIGHAVGLDREQLHELTLGALLHDRGKTAIDSGIVTKTGPLTDEEFDAIRDHPVEGLLQFFRLQTWADLPYRQMLVAYEHHLKTDLSGYPPVRRPRGPALFSRIVTVADAFDALTSDRSYREALRPDEVLAKMRGDSVSWDPVLVKVLINVTGVYPAGSVVRLDTREVGVVLRKNPDPVQLSRPIVKLLFDPEGAPLEVPPVVDLAEADRARDGRPRRIVETLMPEPLGIDVAEHVTR